ncbi:MAG TPA: phenylalanine--tRNA ligase subunit beta [Elusimicrobia bacterium]|nr:phenylalanine--tRNA ligase subunit beta [Elusimicrobiota bacterium]HBT60262.1 phenylalanine--tRNA ligase subunit beta [Elusimicrobiota bacterium]
MKVSYNWLKEHIALELPAEDLADQLLQLGFEVTAVENRGPGFSGVVTGQVLAVDKHPNADRLSLCQVDDGTQKHSVVCGAANVAAGQKVALARLGAVLPGGFKIERAKIRGVESQGMICSRQELGLGENGGGIWVMDPASPVGRDLAEALGHTDQILDVEFTPNRPDCLSHLGLARELSAFFQIPLRAQPASRLPAGAIASLGVEVNAPQACPRYVGRSLEGLRIGPSPGWLAAKLEAVGLRPINNLVDITNYLLMDMGQPMHAFDMDRLEGSIVVRFARPGEKIIALDEKEYALSERCLVIADQKKPVAIAGVMGGRDTGVTDRTTRAFLESALFDPATTRRTSQALKLKSDASYRFERGVDPEASASASARATELIVRLCGRDVKFSEPLERRAQSQPASPIIVTSARLNAILGTSLEDGEVESILRRVSAGFEKQAERLSVTVPSFRRDLTSAWDLAEEVARLSGYDKIPYRLAPSIVSPSPALPAQAAADRCRQRLAALGLCEAYNYDLISEKQAVQARLDVPLARVLNPISEEYAALRPTLLIGLLENARLNLNNGSETVRLFEIGKIYARTAEAVAESTHAAAVLLGPALRHWKAPRGQRLDIYDAKGVLGELLAGIPHLQWLPLDAAEARRCPGDPLFHPRASLRLVLPDGLLATVGLIHPQAARAWELEREGACLFDVDLDRLCALKPHLAKFSAFSVFPGASRDLSFLVGSDVAYGRVEEAIRSCRAAPLRDVELVDKFTGQGVPQGRQSLTVRLVFGCEDRTLKDAEVASAVESILAELSRRLGAVLRS